MNHRNLHLFSHGVTTLVVEVLARDDAGQATCRIVRCVYPPGRHSPEFWQAQHDQPSPGDEIILPASELRRCEFGVRLRAKSKSVFAALDSAVIIAVGVLVGAVMLFCLAGPAPRPVDAQSVRELARMDNIDPSSHDFHEDNETRTPAKAYSARKYLSPADWKTWLKEYRATGRNGRDLVNDLKSGGPKHQK